MTALDSSKLRPRPLHGIAERLLFGFGFVFSLTVCGDEVTWPSWSEITG